MPSNDQATISALLSKLVQRIRSKKAQAEKDIEIAKTNLLISVCLFLNRTKKPIIKETMAVGIWE